MAKKNTEIESVTEPVTDLPMTLDDVLNASVPTVTASAEDIADMTKLGDFLPRLQLLGASCDLVKSETYPVGYAIIEGQDVTYLGKNIDVLLISFRPKALRIPSDKSEQPMAYFDRNDPAFKKVQIDSMVKDSGCMFGSEFLVWVPSKQVFASLFMGTISARKASSGLLKLMQKEINGNKIYVPAPASLSPEYIKKPKFSWHVVKADRCSTPFQMPTTIAYNKELEKFKNPKSSTVETVAPDTRER